jgi:prepilin-type N-terminal cleavage/methylation domain-containing protein
MYPVRETSGPRRAPGFTLIEMLMSLVLALLLMMVLLSVITSMRRGRDQVLKQDWADEITTTLVELFRHDLSYAQNMTSAPGKIRIDGIGGLSDATLDATHLPAQVTYRLDERGGRQCLFRVQKNLGELSNRAMSSELVAVGVRDIQMQVQTEETGLGREATVKLTWEPWVNRAPLEERWLLP